MKMVFPKVSKTTFATIAGIILITLLFVLLFTPENKVKRINPNYNVIENERVLPEDVGPNASFDTIDVSQAKTLLEKSEDGRNVKVIDRKIKIVEGEKGKIGIVYRLYEGSSDFKLTNIINEHGEPDLVLDSMTNESNNLLVYVKKGIGFDINPFNKNIYYTLSFSPTTKELFLSNWAIHVADLDGTKVNY